MMEKIIFLSTEIYEVLLYHDSCKYT